MANVQVQNDLIGYQQKAQTGRTQFTPGKESSLRNDANWPLDFPIYTGVAAVDSLIDSNKFRISAYQNSDEKIIGAAVIAAPEVTDTNIIDINLLSTTTPIDSTYTQTVTTTQDNNGNQEKRADFTGFIA